MQEKKKNPDQGKVGEMGKPSLQSKFEASMQEQRDAMMGKGKDNSEKFEGAMQKAFMSRFKN
jgi:hypothetical protein